MPLWNELLTQAHILVQLDGDEPAQASLRRAISASYYGLFHFLTGAAADCFVPPEPDGLRDAFQRTFDHRRMKTACDEFRAAKVPALLQPLLALPVAPELLQLARNFVDLQAARQSADYDLRLILTRIEALTLVRAAEEAVASWQRVAAQPNSAVFLARLAGMVGMR